MTYAINIHTLLEQIDRRNFALYDELEGDDDLKKEIDKNLGYLLPLWMSGAVNDADHETAILRFDEVCNAGWFALREHPKVQMLLLCAAGRGKPMRHKFFGTRNPKSYSRVQDVLRTLYPDIRKEDVNVWVIKHSDEDFATLLTRMGLQDVEAKEIVKEYKAFKKEVS